MAKHGWGKYALKHPERAEFYASAGWRPRRARHLLSNPFCVVCGEKATAADHIINLAIGGTFDGPLQSLCAEHHRQKTQAEIEAGQQAGGNPGEEGTMNLIGYHIVQQETAEEAKRIRKELDRTARGPSSASDRAAPHPSSSGVCGCEKVEVRAGILAPFFPGPLRLQARPPG